MNKMKKIIILSFLGIFIIGFNQCQKDHLEELNTNLKVLPQLIYIDSAIKESILPKDIQRKAFSTEDGVQIRAEQEVIYDCIHTIHMYPMLDFYFTRDQIDPGYKYVSVVTPIDGNPDLSAMSYLRSRVPPYRMIRFDYKTGVETTYFTLEDMQSNECELNFCIKAKMGTKFHWLVYREEITPIIDDNITCTCNNLEEAQTLICEHFENKEAAVISTQSEYFDEPTGLNIVEPAIRIEAGFGFESNAGLWMQEDNLVETSIEAHTNLGSMSSGEFIFSFKMNIATNATAQFTGPKYGGQYTFNGDGTGSLKLFGWYTFSFRFNPEEWITPKFKFEPARGLYSFEIQNRSYYWMVHAPDHSLDKFIFSGTELGYGIDNICFEQVIIQ